MQPTIQSIPDKKLVGKKQTMSLANNRTVDLWKRFMPERKQIQNSINTTLYSLTMYNADYFHSFSPDRMFTKWAAVEVSGFENIPENMETFTVPAGLYAVFHHKGASTDTAIFQYIFTIWMPASGYVLDNRPHFEMLGEHYRKNDPEAEEEIWIPICENRHR